eukprot:gnl/TRDRNA2_/TRDRNA2_185607_c0_seq1.p1 gnl/TRDRNA2_/TRDRNA2_185607_c0~~gnl/TRDRNA2_/TRDRNA2_185607_c0_seq1.p1  ORF type:complete len:329 (-),score=79.67 gnl/TRDRNA2_/TRDRNA2_185607_c0_seq1:116-1102(-)
MTQVVAFHLLILLVIGCCRPAAGGLRTGSQADAQLTTAGSDEDDTAAMAAVAATADDDSDSENGADDGWSAAAKETVASTTAAAPQVHANAQVALLTKVQGAKVMEAVQAQEKAIEALESQQEALAAQQEALTEEQQRLAAKESEVDAILSQYKASGVKTADLPTVSDVHAVAATAVEKVKAAVHQSGDTVQPTAAKTAGAAPVSAGPVALELNVLRNRGKERFERIKGLVNGIPFVTMALMVTCLVMLGFLALCMSAPRIGKLGVELPTKIATGVPGMIATGFSKMQMPSAMQQMQTRWGERAPDDGMPAQPPPMSRPQVRIPGGPR